MPSKQGIDIVIDINNVLLTVYTSVIDGVIVVIATTEDGEEGK